jgi:hypothetical protein
MQNTRQTLFAPRPLAELERGVKSLGLTGRLLLIAAGLALLGFASGVRPIVEYSDLTCPVGSTVRHTSVAYWAVQCIPSAGSSGPSSTPTRRYVGIFLSNLDVRVFDADLLAGAFGGPAFNVSLGR